MYTYGPRKATIKKYVLVANEIQNEIIKNNGKLDYAHYNATVKKHSITPRFLTDWVKLNLLLRVGKGIYKPVHTLIEPIHIRKILMHRNKLQTNYSLQARLAKNSAKDKFLRAQEFINAPKHDGFYDPFASKDLSKKISDQDEFPFTSNLPRPPGHPDYQKKPTYNYVKPEKHEKKQKSFSLFWGLINIKF
jgi:hypothetical protein